uniref:Uncharacterized protein n=1 Tax=Tetraselmis chuii TaxID=63592 RepID=A0A7S1SNP6_9CHLO
MPSKAVTLEEKLAEAINDADETTVEQLLEKGADPNWENPLGFTQLMVACENCRPSLVRMLVSAGGDLSRVSFYRRTPLSFAIVNNNVEVVQVLLEMGMDLGQRIMEEQYTYLIYAAKFGFKEICERLVEMGVDVHLADKDGLNAIDHARRGRFNITTAFLEDAMHNPKPPRSPSRPVSAVRPVPAV